MCSSSFPPLFSAVDWSRDLAGGLTPDQTLGEIFLMETGGTSLCLLVQPCVNLLIAGRKRRGPPRGPFLV